VSALFRGRPDAYGCSPGYGWQHHCDGAAAEMAVAKWLGVYWEPLAPEGDLSRILGDVGEYEVRSTRNPQGSLILHERDAGDKMFYLVINAAPRFVIAGSLLAADGKRNEFWRTDRPTPAYFVPQDFLQRL
jgi:hypothetical protein